MKITEEVEIIVKRMLKDAKKAILNGNKSATLRSRKDAQLLKKLIPDFRKEIITSSKAHPKNNKKINLYGK